MLNPRLWLSSLAVGLVAGGSAFAGELTLDDVSAWLNATETLQSPFTQLHEDGSIVYGTLIMHRPGRIRFEYEGEEAPLVIVGGGSLAIFDPRSNDGPERYPLWQTPLRIVLDRNVDLAASDMVKGIESDEDATIVSLEDPEHPEYGEIRLVFTDAPIMLRQWVLTDGGGGETTIHLDAVETGIKVNDGIFNIRAEIARRESNG